MKKIIQILIALLIVVFPILFYYIYTSSSAPVNSEENSPEGIVILNSPKDITNTLIQKIANNDLKSLVINYPLMCESSSSDNPFKLANTVKPLQTIDFKVLLGPNGKTLDCAFEGLTKLEYVNISDTSNVISMKRTFEGAEKFNQPIGSWDTSKVTDMSCMFSGASSFNQPIGNWNTGNVTNMSCMFASAANFNQPIGNWNVSKVRNITSMFYNARSFDQDLGQWDTSNIEVMRMTFYGATSFSHSLRTWYLPKVNSKVKISGFSGGGSPSFELPPVMKKDLK